MLPQIKKMLVSIDFSENSAYVFLYAVNAAIKHDAKLVILHVMEPMSHMVSTYAGKDVEPYFTGRRGLLTLNG